MGRPSDPRMPPLVPSMRNCGRPSSRGSQPMPAFCVRPKMSPLGRSSSISAVSGSLPGGPAAAVWTCHSARSESTIASKVCVVMGGSIPACIDHWALRAGTPARRLRPMTTRVVVLALLVGLAAAPAPVTAQPGRLPSGSAIIWRRHVVAPETIRVHDGDTFYTGVETIRLRGIDTPELGQPRARQAMERLIQLLHEGPVTIVPRAEDVYGRTVADVYVRGRDVAATLRREGLAKRRG